jgi:hypothetical protein
MIANVASRCQSIAALHISLNIVTTPQASLHVTQSWLWRYRARRNVDWFQLSSPHYSPRPHTHSKVTTIFFSEKTLSPEIMIGTSVHSTDSCYSPRQDNSLTSIPEQDRLKPPPFGSYSRSASRHLDLNTLSLYIYLNWYLDLNTLSLYIYLNWYLDFKHPFSIYLLELISWLKHPFSIYLLELISWFKRPFSIYLLELISWF